MVKCFAPLLSGQAEMVGHAIPSTELSDTIRAN